jgi:NAD-dependent dihydropyrimidine dehydrogenase PreA subunit
MYACLRAVGFWPARVCARKDIAMLEHVITEPCVGTKDASCVLVCPVDAIHPRKDESGFLETKQLFIDPDTCIGCGLCVDECPVKAIFPIDDVPAEWKHYIQLNADHYKQQV